MPRRHPPIPHVWLMTDERIEDSLWEALDRLPRGAGVVFRHYGLPLSRRRHLFARVLRVARRRGLVLLRAGNVPMRGEMGVHGARGRGLRSQSAHNRREAISAIRGGADVIFVSPVFATRSHPGTTALGPIRFGLVIRDLQVPVIALGGMDRARARRLGARIHGWAGIDAWTKP